MGHELPKIPLRINTNASLQGGGLSNDDLSPVGSSGMSNMILGSPGVARRAKAHVPSACVNCKKKHLACETKRPCSRCIQSGKEGSCVDVQHKKRGRPRLRDEESGRGTGYGSEISSQHMYSGQNSVTSLDTIAGGHSKLSYRELRSHPGAMYDERQSVSPGLNRTSISGPLYGQRGTCNKSLMSPQALSENIPTALLTLDFTIARSNFAFSDALSLPPDVEGQPLKDLVISSEKAKIQRLQNSLRIELQDKAHPSSLHASPHDINFISAIEPRDLYGATAGFQARSEYWTFRLPRERSRGFPISICLAKSSVYFIMLTLVSSASPMVTIPSPVSQGSGTQSLASPVSVHSTRSPSLERILDRTRRSGTSHGKLAYHSQSTSSALYQTSHTSHGHYPHNSPSQSYDSASSPHGSTDTSKSSTHGRDDSHEDLRHLQLPPIRTNNIGESTAPASFKIATSMGKQSPSKIHPANSKRDKRRRVDIHEMLR